MNNDKKNSSYCKSLHMFDVTKESISFIINNSVKIINSIRYPCIVIIIISLFLNKYTINVIFLIINLYLYNVIVVRIHRVFLLDETEFSFKRAFLWRSSNTGYLLTTIAIVTLAIVVIVPLVVIIGSYEKIVIIIAYIPIGYIISRFSLVLPSIAINDRIDFNKAWKISKGQGWKVFLLIFMLPFLFEHGIEVIYYDSIFLRPLFSFLSIIVMVFVIIVLSNTYKKLNSNANISSCT